MDYVGGMRSPLADDPILARVRAANGRGVVTGPSRKRPAIAGAVGVERIRPGQCSVFGVSAADVEDLRVRCDATGVARSRVYEIHCAPGECRVPLDPPSGIAVEVWADMLAAALCDRLETEYARRRRGMRPDEGDRAILECALTAIVRAVAEDRAEFALGVGELRAIAEMPHVSRLGGCAEERDALRLLAILRRPSAASTFLGTLGAAIDRLAMGRDALGGARWSATRHPAPDDVVIVAEYAVSGEVERHQRDLVRDLVYLMCAHERPGAQWCLPRYEQTGTHVRRGIGPVAVTGLLGSSITHVEFPWTIDWRLDVEEYVVRLGSLESPRTRWTAGTIAEELDIPTAPRAWWEPTGGDRDAAFGALAARCRPAAPRRRSRDPHAILTARRRPR